MNLSESITMPLESFVPNFDISPTPASLSYSDTQFEIIKKRMQDFENSLDDLHEVGLTLANFGTSITMRVTEIGYEDPVLMVFKGEINGNPATLIQHVSQINLVLIALPKQEDRPKRPIGFVPPQAGKALSRS